MSAFTNEPIGVFALVVSALTFVVHYRNMVERRHGEISKLRSDYLGRISVVKNRIRSTKIHMESTRIEMRKLPDSAAKYESIEDMPGQIALMDECEADLQSVYEKIEAINTKKANYGTVLIEFQAMEHAVAVLEPKTSLAEDNALRLLQKIRARIEADT